MLAQAARSSKERNLFVFALIFSALVWLAICVSIVGLFYAPFVALGVVVAHAFVLARITGNSIRVGSRQFPELYKRVENGCAKLGMERMPEVYVTTGGGILNAFATKLFSRSFIILNSEILDACETLDEGKGPNEPRAVDFIIGHELGHLALGHLSWNWLLWPAKLVPLLGPAYSRACEYSSDACGLAVADDATAAGKALAVLAAGGKHARQVSLDALVEQRHDTGSFIMALVELNATHPYLSKRVAAVQRLRDGGYAPEVGRNPLAYVLAPFFAGATTYLMAYVALIGVMAAVAMPNLLKDADAAKLLFGADAPADLVAPVAILNDVPANAFAQDEDEDDAPPPRALEDLIAEMQKQQALQPSVYNAYGTVTDEDEDEDEDQDEDADEDVGPRYEARLWLKGQLVAKNPAAISNTTTAKAAAFVEKLYKSGAAKVWVSDIGVGDDGVFANEITAEMPAKPALRKKLVDVCTAEFAKQGFTEPCEDNGVDALFFYWE